MLTSPFIAASVAGSPGATLRELNHLQPGRGADMGLPAPAQGGDGKRVHVDPKGEIGALLSVMHISASLTQIWNLPGQRICRA